MTTIIIIIIAVAVLAGLGSKIFLKSSSGLSDQGGMAPARDKSSPVSKKEKTAGFSAEKTLKMSSSIDTSGTMLFRPPPEATLFTGRKELLKKIASQATTRPVMIGINGFSGSRENLPDHPIEHNVRLSVSRCLPVYRHAGKSPGSAFCGGYHAADYFEISPYPAPAR